VIAVELTKQVRRARGWVTLGIVAAVSAVLTLVIGSTQASIPERIGDWESVVTNTSGFTLPLIALNAAILFLLPLVVAVFAGEPVAAEAGWGSLRYLLARPVRRWRVLAAKGVVAAGFSGAAVLTCVLVALVTGVMAYGWQPLSVIDLQHSTPFHLASATFTPAAATERLALAIAFVLASLASTFSFSLLLSTMTARPFSAVAGGIGLSLFSRALDNVPGLHALGPWLPVTDRSTSLWTGFFTSPLQGAGVWHALLVQLLYTAAFLVAALGWFTRSDILS
jgi:ABC-2 type transport system permease protein